MFWFIWSNFSTEICLFIKFACANLALKTSRAKVLNSGVVI